jgi:diaminohydroxyphosphoribosylaminopyrimidine deaminase/5-amino-6-(5-phosphoribosylamino)uracil reductase
MPTPPTDQDLAFLRRAIRLAMNGRGHVEPNPMVGCVLVKNGHVVGEGWHGQFGGPHAEPTALADCRANGHDPAGATAYVTLEPCCHTNKKTPPCAPRLIEAKVARVVIGCLDPNPDVNGKGVAILRAARIQVDGPVLEGEAKQLIEVFLNDIDCTSPYMTVKWAESADGKVAGPGGRRTQISGPEASRLVHQLRARCDGIVVGIGTVLNDDPMLTPRGVAVRRKPTRVVLDARLRLPLKSQLVQTAHEWPTAVIAEELIHEPARIAALRARNVSVHQYEGFADRPDDTLNFVTTRQLMGEELDVREVLVEPGPTLARSVLRVADRVWVFRSSNRFDDPTAPAAVPVPNELVPTGTIRIGADELTEYRRPMFADEDGDTYFTPVPSADFVLAAGGGGLEAKPPEPAHR